ncbi:MAG: DNA/RNA non-specific endonuclease [Pirellulales bacterium]
MSAPANIYSFAPEVALAAASRWIKREPQHAKFESAVRQRRYSALDTPERMAKRANRLMGKLAEKSPTAASALSQDLVGPLGSERALGNLTAETVSDQLLERVIGETRDFLFIEFLEQALHVAKAVARLVTRLSDGRLSYGTGFMVSADLLLTNHHVLEDASSAARTVAQFNYQRNRQGVPLTVEEASLDPARFFLTDQELDFSLVAVKRTAPDSPIPFCPLMKEEGKIVVGEPINIIQHPLGEMKQVIIRENRLLDMLDLFTHYEADTEPGSSGSPVFNNQWEVVALHHSGVPRRNAKGDLLRRDGKPWRHGVDPPQTLDWVANEGVRVSRLVDRMSRAKVADPDGLLQRALQLQPAPIPAPHPSQPVTPATRELSGAAVNGPAHQITLTIPLQVTLSIGEILNSTGVAPVGTSGSSTSSAPPAADLEAIRPDPDDPRYERRLGYDEQFLGFDVPLPSLGQRLRPKAFALPDVTGPTRYQLKYHHFTVVFNKERRLAIYAAVNFDPTAPVQLERQGKDTWYYDPRLPRELQAGEGLYRANSLDRGHLVRRADAAWGHSEEEAVLSNDDTFHFTNCSPQHAIFNQGKTNDAPPGLVLWGKLEQHVADQGRSHSRKLVVFNGPVFRPDDPPYRDVQLPQEFWKLIVFPDAAGESRSVAFVLSQRELLDDLEEAFVTDQYKPAQVTVDRLHDLTGLDFGSIADWDVMVRPEAEEHYTAGHAARIINSLEDVYLP